jgi:hypothetical protein
MSGTGKSAIVAELGSRGFRAVDLDGPAYSEWVDASEDDPAPGSPVAPGRDWVWREREVGELLADGDGEELFVSGCAANMGRFLPRFAHVILLSAPVEVLLARLRMRSDGDYGAAPAEPLLRRAADHELDTSGSVTDAADAVLALVGVAAP